MLRRVLVLIGALVLVTAGAVVAENVHTVGVNQYFASVDPAIGSGWTETAAFVNLYDALVEPLAMGGVSPHVATSWEISADGKQYTFQLRDDVAFHSGDTVTAEDVAFSMERVLRINQGYAWLWATVLDPDSCCEVLDTHTIRFNLTSVFTPFLDTLTYLFIVDKDLVMSSLQDGDFGDYGDYGQAFFASSDAGSGAYKLKDWRRGEVLVFERFAEYFKGWPRPNPIDEVQFKQIPSEVTIVAEMTTGALTQCDHWRSTDLYGTIDELPNAKVVRFYEGTIFKFQMNVQREPTSNVHVRRAISYAFDYDTYLEIIEPGAEQARGPVASFIPMHATDAVQYNYDPAKAAEELALSGYNPGELTVEFVYVLDFLLVEKVGLLLQQNLGAIGIDVVLRPETWSRMVELASTPETSPQLMAVYGPSNYLHPDSYLWPCYHSSSAGTWASSEWVQDPEIDQWLEEARRTLDEERAAELYRLIQVKLTEEAVDVFLNPMFKRYPVQDYVEGITPMPIMGYGYNMWSYWYNN